MRQMESLHQHVETWCSEDTANRRWDTTRLHEDITAVQNTWSQAVAAPTAQVERLTTEKQKLLSVTEKIVQTGVTLKKKLKESLDTNTKLMDVNQRNLSRGRAWKRFAEGIQASQATLNEKYDVATTALEILAKRHKALRAESDESVVRLGRRVLELEFADRVKNDSTFAAKLREAKTPEALASLRESITTRKPAAKNVPATNESKETPKARLTESAKTGSAEEKPKAGGSTDTGNRGTMVVPVGNPRNVSESIAIARRLTAATTGSQQ
jgi:predicted nuclease with TOPRIM domain